ncbi:MAG TPA: tetratricopeptide repeat protein [Planctomycetota bacterium]|nr:tetratricopeptide repeat protein [Planctomycetota bacterium]
MKRFLVSAVLISIASASFNLSLAGEKPERAALLAKAGKVDEAVNLLLGVESVAGRSIIERKSLAKAFQDVHDELTRRGDTDAAYKAAERARALFPKEKRSGMNLGELCMATGKFQAAANILKECAAQSSSIYAASPGDDLRIHLLLARASLVLGKLPEARKAISKATDIAPADPQLLYLKAQVAMAQGKWDEAGKALDNAFKINPQLAQPVDYLVRASCYLQQKAHDLAKKTIEEGLGRYPTASGLHCALGRVHQAAGRPAEAFYEFQCEIMLSGPKSSYSDEASAQIEIITALLSKEKDPDNYLKIGYGVVALRNMKPGSYENAVEEIKKGLRTVGDNCLPLQMLLGMAYVDLGQYADAIKAFEAALMIDLYFVPAYVDLADVYLKLGQKERAITLYAKAMTYDRNNWRVKEMLKEIDNLRKE